MISCNSLDIIKRGVQLDERLAPALFAGRAQVFGEPLADLESRPPVGLVVELDPQVSSRTARSLLQPATDVA